MKKIKKINYPLGFKINAFRHIPIGWKPDANNPNLQLGMRKDLTPKKFFKVCKKFNNLGAKIRNGLGIFAKNTGGANVENVAAIKVNTEAALNCNFAGGPHFVA